MTAIVKDRPSLLWPSLVAIIYGLGFVLTLELSSTWLILIFLGTAGLAFLFCLGDPKDSLLYVFIFTSAFEFSKALIVKGGVYSSGLSLQLSDLSLLPLLFLWFFENKIVQKRRLIWRSKLHRIAALLLAWLWFTAIISKDPLAGVLGAVVYTKFFFIFLILSDYIKTPRQVRRILVVLGLSLLFQVLMACAQVATGSPLEIQGTKITTLGTRLVFEYAGGTHAFRPQGFLGHPNVLADFCVFILPVFATLVLGGRRIIGRHLWWFSVIVAILGTGVLVMTLSRGGWISFFMATVFILVLGFRFGLVSRQQLTGFALSCFFFGIVTLSFYPSAIYRITERDQRSTDARLAMMNQALLIIEKNPIAGVGLGGYNRAAQTTIPMSWSNLGIPFQETLLKGIVHNKYLLTAAENGLIGLMLMLAVLFIPLISVWKINDWPDPAYYVLALGLAAAIFGQIFFYLFDHFYNDVRIHYLWIYLGLLSALARMQSGCTTHAQHHPNPAGGA